MQTVLQAVQKEKVIAILRRVPSTDVLHTAQALYEGGIRLMEVTFDQSSDNALQTTSQAIKVIKAEFGSDVFVGAGTVLNDEQLMAAHGAGAQYIISPHTDPNLIKRTIELGLVSMPGAYTPSEVMNAYSVGAAAVKIFPTGSNAIEYIKAIRAPLSHIPMLAVGGVTADNMSEFLKAGAVAVGVGSNLVNLNAIKNGDFAKITDTAKSYTGKV